MKHVLTNLLLTAASAYASNVPLSLSAPPFPLASTMAQPTPALATQTAAAQAAIEHMQILPVAQSAAPTQQRMHDNKTMPQKETFHSSYCCNCGWFCQPCVYNRYHNPNPPATTTQELQIFNCCISLARTKTQITKEDISTRYRWYCCCQGCDCITCNHPNNTSADKAIFKWRQDGTYDCVKC